MKTTPIATKARVTVQFEIQGNETIATLAMFKLLERKLEMALMVKAQELILNEGGFNITVDQEKD